MSFTSVMTEAEFRKKLAEVEKLNSEIGKHCAALFDHCNRAIGILPWPLSNELNNALRRLSDLLRKFFEEISKVISNPGRPSALRLVGDDWTKKVGGPASQLSPKIAQDQLRIDNYWKGPAADAYAKILPAQQKALEAIKAATDPIDSSLHKVADGFLGFWVGIALALLSFSLELLAEVIAAATGVGAPSAAAAAAASAAKVIGTVLSLISAFAFFTNCVMDSLTTLKQTMYANAAFPDGRWPKATTSDFNDGSLSDGDRTDWRINTYE